MNRVYLSLGSNLGDRLALLRSAMKAIQTLPQVFDFSVSKIYETSPVSPVPQGNFLNAACSLVTDLSPFTLLSSLQDIEKRLGKIPKAKTAPRPIDIDILFFGDQRIDTSSLQVPHPSWKERLFVLIPLSDLTDELFCPVRQEKIDLHELLENFVNQHGELVTPYPIDQNSSKLHDGAICAPLR